MLPTRIVHEHRVKAAERSRAVADSRAKIACGAQNIERRRSVRRLGGDSFKPRNHRAQESGPIVGVDAERLEGDGQSWLCAIAGWNGRSRHRDLGGRVRPECRVSHHKLPGREGNKCGCGGRRAVARGPTGQTVRVTNGQDNCDPTPA